MNSLIYTLNILLVQHLITFNIFINNNKVNDDRILGGLADNMPDEDFDSQQLAMGSEVELEHTDDPVVSKEIAKDHLEEHPKYYTHLKNMEDLLKKETP